MKLSMDSDAIIKLTKAGAKEAVAGAHVVLLAPAVQREAVEQGKEGGYGDALLIEQNVRIGRVATRDGRRFREADALLAQLGLSPGEEDALRLYLTARADAVVSDDVGFLRLLQALGVLWITPAHVLVEMVRAGELPREAGFRFLEQLKPMIASVEYLAAKGAMGGD